MSSAVPAKRRDPSRSERPRWRRRGALSAAAVLAALALGVGILASTGGPSSDPGTSSPTPGGDAHAPSAGAAAQPPPTTEQFGASVNRLFNDHAYSGAQIDAQLQALAATGATVARSDALWEATEPAPPSGGKHRYDWGFDDLIAGSLAQHGLRWLPILDYSPSWARTVPGLLHSPPASASQFATFAAAFAARYGPGGAFWREHPQLAALPVDTYEVWNEPDNPEFWSPTPDPASYVDLYLSARDAVDAVDPSARVIVGGLSDPAAFVPAMIDARPDLAGHVDGIAIHPYGANPSVVLARVRAARQVLVAAGLGGAALYVTEFGWTTHPASALGYAPAQARPGYIATALAALGHTDCGVAAALLYTWVTPERDLSDHNDWFGIHPPGGGASTDTDAFVAGLREALAPAPTSNLCG